MIILLFNNLIPFLKRQLRKQHLGLQVYFFKYFFFFQLIYLYFFLLFEAFPKEITSISTNKKILDNISNFIPKTYFLHFQFNFIYLFKVTSKKTTIAVTTIVSSTQRKLEFSTQKIISTIIKSALIP